MKILLISPPRVSDISVGQTKFFSRNMAIFPPLSLLPLASFLHQESSHIAKVLDLAIERNPLQKLNSTIENFTPEAVGITCMLNNWFVITQILQMVKHTFPKIKTVIGGYNTSEFPHESVQNDHVDFMILGTGQVPLKELLDGLEKNSSDLSKIKGLFIHNSNKSSYDDEKLRINPDEYPFPDRGLVSINSYRSAISQRFPSTVMISSDGCPFNCNFCNTSNMKNILIRDPIKVVDEMEECVKIGIREIMFQDELFTIKKERVLRISNEILNRKLDIVWNFKSRINLIEEDLLPILKKAGCNNIHFGIENGNDEILEKMNKGITTEKVLAVFAMLKKHKIPGSASFMLAYPSETRAQIENTIDFAIKLNPSYVQFSVTCDFPGSKIYLNSLANGKYKEDIYKKFILKPTADFTFPYSSELFTREELDNMLKHAYRKYYFRYGYIKRRLSSIKSPGQFINQAKIALGLFNNR
ncbi:MAG: B12-binding domain-containing radical SAM protein [Oligoflexia bacterium]|nr:B12-binding domain-containing radical SAM protein [Oligoflexia bacterium]